MRTIITLLLTITLTLFMGCTEINCPIVSTPNGSMAIYGKGSLNVFVACNGKTMEVVSLYKFDYCPSDAERKILASAIDVICTNTTTTLAV